MRRSNDDSLTENERHHEIAQILATGVLHIKVLHGAECFDGGVADLSARHCLRE